MSFDAFGDDVLLEILFFCDISTVLAVSAARIHSHRINKSLRRLALWKQLWLSLVLDPRFRDTLELPPPDREKFECLSTEALIAIVKNAVAGPGSLWEESSYVTMTSFQIPLDYMEDSPECHLLLGARYFLLHSRTQHTLCIYDVWSARHVWECPVQGRTLFQVDLVPGGAIARIFFVQTVDHFNTYMLHVEEVNLTTGESHEVFNFSIDRIVLGITLRPCAIVGDFLLATLLLSSSVFVLINWRASTFVSFNGLSHVRLIPGYILSTHEVTFPPSARGHILAATALEVFSDRWQPLTGDGTGLAAQVKAGSVSITFNSSNITTWKGLEYSGRPIRSEMVSVARNALHAGAYDISLSGLQFLEPPPPPRRVTLMERIGNRILSMAGTARRGKACPVLTQVTLAPAQAVLCYRFTPAVSAAGEACSLRLVSIRHVSHPSQAHCVRAIVGPSHSNSITVVYRERKRTVADAS
ncbi:hypothetical protein MSAN_01532700 [Mycena sanguinolenta]|uniref:F-box domain-containing protein n=1 Tax=Mycena sanguinolenta TaxID=230812 RepID=A0A8H6Y8A8_9AGAR|nr:hypothetical protein MSAN_01532700 [Mycena sanguinolenta]